MNFIDIQKYPLEGKRIAPIFVRGLTEEGLEYFAEADWDGEDFYEPYYGQDVVCAHERVTHYCIPSLD